MEDLAIRTFGTPRALALSVLALLGVLLIVAAWMDLRARRIPNLLAFAGAGLAVVLNAALPAGDGFAGSLPGGLGALSSLQGWAYGLAAFLPFYMLRAFGAGDVKLMAMVGAFLGSQAVWGALFSVLLTGGLLSVAVALRRHVLVQMLHNIRLVLFAGAVKLSGGSWALPDTASVTAGRFPYAVAIAGGTICYLAWRMV